MLQWTPEEALHLHKRALLATEGRGGGLRNGRKKKMPEDAFNERECK
jgi:hypothetical protein